VSVYDLQAIQWSIKSFQLNIEKCRFEKDTIYAVLGPNGSGKTSLLNLLALLYKPNAGTVFFQGSRVDFNHDESLLTARRRIAYLLQSPYLFNMSVRDNVRYGLKVRGYKGRQVEFKVDGILDRMHLSHLVDRTASELSGGEAQRVALARVLVLDADVYLLDEPTANVDKESVHGIEQIILDRKQSSRAAIIMTTHSQDQARRMSENILSMVDGSVQDFSYDNAFTGTLHVQGDGLRSISVGSNVQIAVSHGSEGPVTVVIDPREIILSREKFSSSALNAFHGTIRKIESHGEVIHLTVSIGVLLSATITQRSFQHMGLNVGQNVWISFKASAVRIL